VLPNGLGSVVRGTIRRSRAILLAPLLGLLLLLYGWVRGDTYGLGSTVVILVGIVLLVVWSLLFSLFSTDKHEAEADVLVALVRTAAQRADDGSAGAHHADGS